MKIPYYVETAIEKLNNVGYEAYAVGGCVRDSLMGKSPHDWDICTSALPLKIKEVFSGCPVIETGIKHGTVTVVIDGNHIEITTFRKDGNYTDSRHPENVEFVTSLEEDLKRRDFTINALCFSISEEEKIIDLFGGKADIENKIIRCVGKPEERFGEDALRILRAMRFASTLGFEIEEETSRAIHLMKDRLLKISAERCRDELVKLLCGENVGRVLYDYKDVVAVIIPEIKDEFGFLQHNPHHCYDVYTHTVRAVEIIRNTRILRLIMLLHDIGKPSVFRLDENGIGHFKLHPTVGSEMARDILNRLKFDNYTKSYVCRQIWEHDNRFPAERKSVRRFISKHGYEFFFDHLEIRRADTLAQSEYLREEKLSELEEKKRIGEQLLKESAPLTSKALCINGGDLKELGFCEGKLIGEILKDCLREVVDENIKNTKGELLQYVTAKYRKNL